MADIVVDVPGVGVVAFPDSMSQQDIDAAAAKLYREAKPKNDVGMAALKSMGAKPVASHAPAKPARPVPVSPYGPLVDDTLGGVKAGLASTVYHGGDLIRWGTNAALTAVLGPRDSGQPYVNRIINEPEVRAAMTPPDSIPGKVGFFGEQVAEFAVPLTKVSKATQGASLGRRILADAAASGAVAGVQSGGDAVQTGIGVAGGALVPAVGGLVRAGARAAAGAREGGAGGAIASAVRAVAPAEPKAMLVQALKPRSTKVNFESSLGTAMPELKQAEQAIGRPIASVDDLLEATKAAKARIQEQLGVLRGGARGFEVDLSPVADAASRSIPKRLQLENPDAALRLKSAADAYRSTFTLEEAETLLREMNADLDAFYAKYPRGQYAAMTADPEYASLLAKAKELRLAIDGTLDRFAGGAGAAAKELRRRYGSLLDVEGEAYRRANVAKRQQPESLSEQIGKVRAASDIARGAFKVARGMVGRPGLVVEGAADIVGGTAGREMATFLKEQQTADALIRRAFASFKGAPVPVEMPPPTQIRGVLGPGARPMPPVPDASGGQRVYAQYGLQGRPKQLPEASVTPSEPPKRVFHMGGEVAPDPPGRLIPAQPAAYDIDPHVKVKAGGVRVSQFSSDPDAVRAAIATPDVRTMLRRMLMDLDTFEPVRGRVVEAPSNARRNPLAKGNLAGGAEYVPGAAGSPVGDDIRTISTLHVGNGPIKQAIADLLEGKMPTNRLHTAALDAAMGYLEKRSGYRGPQFPEELLDAAPMADDDGFDAFSRAVDDILKREG